MEDWTFQHQQQCSPAIVHIALVSDPAVVFEATPNQPSPMHRMEEHGFRERSVPNCVVCSHWPIRTLSAEGWLVTVCRGGADDRVVEAWSATDASKVESLLVAPEGKVAGKLNTWGAR